MQKGRGPGRPEVDVASSSILVVDDDDSVSRMVARMLERAGYRCETASNGAQARSELASGRFELAICDVRMPGESGLELIGQLRTLDPEMAVMMMSGRDDPLVAGEAIERGAYEYLVKPFNDNELLIGVNNALHRRTLVRRERRHLDELEDAVAERTRELNGVVAELSLAQRETVDRLGRAIEARDAHTGDHTGRVGILAALLAGWCGLDEESVRDLRLAAPLHDVGKLGISDEILLKPGMLTEEEREQMRRHTGIGHQLLAGSRSKLLEHAAAIAFTHHEHWDGGGYPSGLRGEQIPIEGRITALADVFEALLSDRVYRPAFPLDEVVEIIRESSGRQFDPQLVEVLLEHLPEATEALGI